MKCERGPANVDAQKHNGSLTNKHNDFDRVQVMGREQGTAI